jgi:hypothetical protein
MRDDGEVGARGLISRVCVRKVKSESRPDHQITFARSFHEALPIKHRDCRRPRAIKPARSISRAALVTVGLWTPSISASSFGDGWPLDTQHFGEQVMSYQQCVIVTAITHHEQPTR